MKTKSISMLTVFVLMVSSTVVAQNNWPQWRGAKLDNISNDKTVPFELNKDDNLLWRVPLPGPAGSSPVVWEDKIFLTTVAEENTMALHCISTSGKPVWKKTLDGKNRNSRDGGNSASPSPSTDGKHVWAMMGDGNVYCFTVDGKLVWKKDLQEQYGKFRIQFGMTSTPVLDKGALYFQLIHGSMRERSSSVGWVVALNAETGKEIWKHKRETDGVMENKHAYTSPVIYRHEKTEYLLVHGADYITAHSLKDGSELWRCGGLNPKGDGYNDFLRFVASPGVGPNMIVVPTAKRKSVVALKTDLKGTVTGKDSAYHWRIQQGTPDVATPVIYNGHVFLACENGVLKVIDTKSGKQVFERRMFDDRHRSTPVAANGYLYVTGREGKLHVVKAVAEPAVVSTVDLDETTNASPAISNGRLFVRTFKALYAFGNKK